MSQRLRYMRNMRICVTFAHTLEPEAHMRRWQDNLTLHIMQWSWQLEASFVYFFSGSLCFSYEMTTGSKASTVLGGVSTAAPGG